MMNNTQVAQPTRNKTRRASMAEPSTQPAQVPVEAPTATTDLYGMNSGLVNFLNHNASQAYKRPWHRLERGLRLNRLSKFIQSEKTKMNLSKEDTEYLTNILQKSLAKSLLNSKTAVVYDQETEEIQEIKGLVYHKTADGKMLSQIVEKKSGVTFRKPHTKRTVNTEKTETPAPK
jgi:hypothetical protein